MEIKKSSDMFSVESAHSLATTLVAAHVANTEGMRSAIIKAKLEGAVALIRETRALSPDAAAQLIGLLPGWRRLDGTIPNSFPGAANIDRVWLSWKNDTLKVSLGYPDSDRVEDVDFDDIPGLLNRPGAKTEGVTSLYDKIPVLLDAFAANIQKWDAGLHQQIREDLT